MQSRTMSLLGPTLALIYTVPLEAHHSFAAQYDATKRVTLTGVVTKVEWMNPHIYIYADIKDDESDAVTSYAFEMGGPNSLIRLGWTRNSLQAGDVVTVEGALARDGSPLVNASSIVMASTGKKMFAGSSQETSP